MKSKYYLFCLCYTVFKIGNIFNWFVFFLNKFVYFLQCILSQTITDLIFKNESISNISCYSESPLFLLLKQKTKTNSKQYFLDWMNVCPLFHFRETKKLANNKSYHLRSIVWLLNAKLISYENIVSLLVTCVLSVLQVHCASSTL